MEKGTKTALIAAAVLMLVGGIVALVCLAMGASMEDADIQIKNPFKQEFDQNQWKEMDIPEKLEWMKEEKDLQTMDFSKETIHSLDLDLEAGTMYISTGEGYQIWIINGRDGMQCQVKNGVLKLKETDSIQTLFDWSGDSTPEILIVIPEDAIFETVKATVGAGGIQAESLRTKTLKVDVDAGSFSCETLDLRGRGEIDVDAGHVEIKDGSVAGELEMDVDAGKIDFCGDIAGDWNAQCDAGAIQMQLTRTMEDYDYHVEYDLGSVTIGSEVFDGVSGEKTLDHDAPYRGSIHCDVGRVIVSFVRRVEKVFE